MSAPTRPIADGDPILQRNVFDSVTGPLGRGIPPAVALDEPIPQRPLDLAELPKCEFGHVDLIIDSGDDKSFAAVTEQSKGESRLYRAGGRVGEYELLAIGWDRLWFAKDRQRCLMKLGDKVRLSRPKSLRNKRRARKSRRRNTLPQEIASKIQKLSPTEFNIERSALDDILEQQAQLMRRTRARPIKKDGAVVGMKISGVRKGTLFETIGLSNGDVIHSINGFDLTDPEKALEAYGRLRSAKELSVQLSRNGKSMSIDYHLK